MWINSINSNKVAEEKRQALLELHKFFGYALNEFARERYITRAQYESDRLEDKKENMLLRQQLQVALEAIERLIRENETLRKANSFRASAASYQMHARKTELKH